jgi:hypothetical protein
MIGGATAAARHAAAATTTTTGIERDSYRQRRHPGQQRNKFPVHKPNS